ncbi:hypothetical protein O9H85_29670 [Paenibacillus filicis]|uniref:Uncharacterized protein n=1 Tax=Paenibacillus gyeongsangnamensis TaxID=3388067 RepID=A0ABT4QHZ1_9BACL|nr:hypothetical protein [Paenibacillus filicis]MCZ8516483.1 hypothetical protein [Paenibacillus filicis]
MQKKLYSKPVVMNHELISFETLLSCKPPNIPGQRLDNGNHVCLKPGGTGWFESK